MDEQHRYYALCLVAAGRSKDVSVQDRMALLSDRYVTSSGGTTVVLTDKGRDKRARKGR